MSSLTTNLKLVKPELQDNITPTIFADNFDKIDAALEGVSGGALSLEEIEASTNLDGKIPSAAALKEVNNSLIANSKHFYFDYKNGKYGYNTNPNRGADTFVPFKNGFDGEIFFMDQNLSIADKCYLISNGEINIVTKSEATTISEFMDISIPDYVYVKAKKKCKMTVYSNDNVVSNINETIVNAGQTVAQFGATAKYNCFIIAENI